MRAVGQSVVRRDAAEKVTGRAVYVGDMKLPGMAYAKLLRSPYARARIVSIDTSRACAMAGVLCVLTSEDLKGIDPYFGPVLKDQPILAAGEVRFQGEPVAAVAAIDERTAAAALERIEVVYDPLPAVMTLDEALAPGAPLVHETPPRANGMFSDVKNLIARASNVVHEFHYQHGEPTEELFQSPEVETFDDVTTYPMIHHVMMEPYGCVADWQGDQVTLHAATQHPHPVRRDIAQIFGLPLSRVRIVVPYIGGAFGGKSYAKVEPIAAALSRACKLPVRLCLTAEEAFQTGRKPSARVRVRTAVSPDGRIVARHIEVYYILGAYADVGPRVTQKAGYTALGPYRIPNARIDAYGVYTNTVPAIAYRGYGVPQTALAYELQMDRIARSLGVDPIELRMRNVLRRGDRYTPSDSDFDADLPGDLAELRHGMPERGSRGPWTGQGMAVTLKTTIAPSLSQAMVRVHADGSASLFTSTVEIGQGAKTALAQIVAETLDIDMAKVQVILADTALTPYDQATSSSRSTTLNGYACQAAARDVIRQLRDIAAGSWGIAPEAVRAEGGVLTAADRQMSYGEALDSLFGMTGAEVVGVGTYAGAMGNVPLSGITPFWEIGLVGATVEIDHDTGETSVHELVSVADVGKAINPALAEAQDEGAVMMGLGHALWEEMVYADGQLVNGNLVDYRVARMGDLPARLESIMVENEDGPGPYGAKGIGEGATCAVATAVAAAVNQAAGIEIRDLPLHPERVWRALRDHALTAQQEGK